MTKIEVFFSALIQFEVACINDNNLLVEDIIGVGEILTVSNEQQIYKYPALTNKQTVPYLVKNNNNVIIIRTNF